MARRVDSAQVGVAAVNLVKEVLNDLNWVVNPLVEDYGVDLHVKTFEPDGERRALPWEFYVQVKGRTRVRHTGEAVAFAVDTGHLRDWYDARLPVVLVVVDVPQRVGYWVLVKDSLDATNVDWEDALSTAILIPIKNEATRGGFLKLLAHIRRTAFIQEAPRVVAFMETPSEDTVYSEHFWPRINNPYKHQALPPADPSVENLALSRCVLCENYFWIDEAVAEGWDAFDADEVPLNPDFSKIYEPRAHEPAVYSCDSPEELCPFCSGGLGAFMECQRCTKYRVPRERCLDDWNDPLITQEEAETTCATCMDELRTEREPYSTRGG